MSAAVYRLRLPSIAAAVVLAIAALAPAARADILALPGTGCGEQQLSQPFTQWGDYASYVLVPGGTFEQGDTPWTLSNGAQVIAGNEPWYVNNQNDQQALSLPAGSSATTPATCASLASPTIRFFASSSGGSAPSWLHVDVLFRTLIGGIDSLSIGDVPATGGAWTPTQPYLFLVNNLAVLGGQYQVVAFRFTPQGDANWEIDDVYEDPWSKG
jgi:hypothetical protein